MASIVIAAIRGEDGPSECSLGAAEAARSLADEVGATVYALCALAENDDLDRWVADLGRAGVDRIACARTLGEANVCHADVFVELARRLSPRIVIVPADGADHAPAIGDAISAAAIPDVVAWNGTAPHPLELDGDYPKLLVLDAKPAGHERGGEDIDVLFFDFDDVERKTEPGL